MGRMVTCAVIVAAMVAFAIFGYNYSDNRAKEIYIRNGGVCRGYLARAFAGYYLR